MKRGVSVSSLTTAFIHKDKLKIELDDLPTILRLYNVEQKKRITDVSRISTIRYF